ncbi:MAG: thiamine phosphate synthase, partial [Muribaculaceae bacterium]|nr:thiamine phosphate synthase [Muribaculaceae bacterium]
MREKNFLTIAFTLPYFFEGEEIAITEILERATADILHLRKPDSTFFQMKSLLEKIPRHLHSKIKIHDHFSLIEEFRLGGVHLNARNPIAPQNVNSLSCSMHTIEQLEAAKHYDYVTLSPIYDSISKPGYRAIFR